MQQQQARASVRILPILVATALAALAGCQPADQTVRSQLAGQWQGGIVTRSTQQKEAIVEDFAVTILPDGRFEWIGLVPGGRIERAGQRLVPPGLGPVTVLRADYQPDESHVVLDLSPAPDAASEAIRSGAAASAWRLPDGRLEFHLFSFSMSAQSADQCDAVSQHGILRRISP